MRTIVSDTGTGRLLTGSFDYTMMLWQLGEDGTAKALRRFDEHDSAVSAVAFHPDGKRALSASDDGSLHLWDLASGKKLHLFKGHDARILGLAIDPSLRLLAFTTLFAIFFLFVYLTLYTFAHLFREQIEQTTPHRSARK